MAENSEKRIVVVTKASMFYVPENGTPMPPTRSVSKINSSFDGTDMGSPSRGGGDYAPGNKAGEKATPSYAPALHAVRVCVLLLALLGVLMVYCTDLVPIVAAGLGGALGYTIAHTQGMVLGKGR